MVTTFLTFTYIHLLILGLAALAIMLIGISLVTKSGFYVFQIFDDYCFARTFVYRFFQVVAVSWVYGTNK